MADFSIISTVVDDNFLELMGVSDLKFVTIGADNFLFVASEADGSVTGFRITAAGAPEWISTLSLSATSGTFAVGYIDIVDIGGVLTLLPSARFDDDVVAYRIDTSGHIGPPVSQPLGSPNLGYFSLTHSVDVAGKTFLFTVTRGVSGIAGYQMSANNSFAGQTVYSSTTFDYFGDVSAFASVQTSGVTYLFTASAFDAGLNSFKVGVNGDLQLIDSVANTDASGFSLPQALETINVSGQSYLVMASAGTDSLTVYAVGSGGSLSEVDHLIDGVNTRFNGASVLDSFSLNGHSYILAAGSDDGLTLLEISAGGQLTFISVLADDFGTTLNNISSIEVVQIGLEIHAFVGSGTENGFTQIKIGLNNVGQTIDGNETDQVLTGTDLDDVISGMGGSDMIYGAAGNDRLIDGTGRDHLYGGEGADTFRFVVDGTLDLIRDYEHGLDLIDLSLLPGFNGINGLDIRPRSYGAVIFAGDEEIRIETIDGAGLLISDFTSDNFIF